MLKKLPLLFTLFLLPIHSAHAAECEYDTVGEPGSISCKGDNGSWTCVPDGSGYTCVDDVTLVGWTTEDPLEVSVDEIFPLSSVNLEPNLARDLAVETGMKFLACKQDGRTFGESCNIRCAPASCSCVNQLDGFFHTCACTLKVDGELETLELSNWGSVCD